MFPCELLLSIYRVLLKVMTSDLDVSRPTYQLSLRRHLSLSLTPHLNLSECSANCDLDQLEAGCGHFSLDSGTWLDAFRALLTPEKEETMKSDNMQSHVHQSSPPLDSGPLHLFCHSNNLMNILLS